MNPGVGYQGPYAAPLTGMRAVIVDLDGTMLHTIPDFEIALNRMRAELGLAPVGQDLVANCVGKGSEHLVRSILDLDFDSDTVAKHLPQALKSYLHHYDQINGDFSTVYPEVAEGLAAMRAKGLRLACVTNKPTAFARELLEHKDLLQYFDAVYGGDAFENRKPHPEPMLAVCSKFELSPSQVVAIGDSSNDAQAARAAGCRVLTVPYGYNHGEAVQNIESDGIVPTLLFAAHLIS